MRKNRSIFIAATGQNVGKTTLCLGILAGLKKRFSQVGFIKPVGQQHIKTADGSLVDKDVVLFKEHFGISSPYPLMSPVLCPAGFTRDFLDNKIDPEALLDRITTSFETLYNTNEYVLVEGTGHIAVGSLFHLNNAKVAQSLDLEVVLIATGGLGSAIDELALNIEMCHAHQVHVRGVILNRVLEEKRSMILEYFPKALKRWNIPLMGAIPYLPYLSIPMMKDFEGLLEVELLSGHSHRLRHFRELRLIAGSLESYRKEIRPNQLIITPACRDEIILATLEQTSLSMGMILTDDIPPKPDLLEKIKKSDIPVLYAPLCSFEIMKMITSFTAKIQKDDLPKIERAIELVEQHIDFDGLVAKVGKVLQ